MASPDAGTADGAVGAHTAQVGAAGADSGKPATQSLRVVGSPTTDAAVGADSARQFTAGCDGRKLPIRGIRLTKGVLAPAGSRTVRSQRARVPAAGGDFGEWPAGCGGLALIVVQLATPPVVLNVTSAAATASQTTRRRADRTRHRSTTVTRRESPQTSPICARIIYPPSNPRECSQAGGNSR